MTMPVMPDDEPFEYLSTQAICDYLASLEAPVIDGIIYPSSQLAEDGVNVVLFHKASKVENIKRPAGAEVIASLEISTDGGYEPDYSVLQVEPEVKRSPSVVDPVFRIPIRSPTP